MSRVRTNTSIEEIDRLAREEGLSGLTKGEKRRTFSAFGRSYEIEEAPPGKVGLFRVVALPEHDDATGYQGMETLGTIRRLFRRAAQWKEERGT